MTLFDNTAIRGNAYIDGNYRYWLERRWDDGPACLFVMLNPSTADASKDDPTIKRCIGFAKAFGMRALWVCNLYAFRATMPEEIFKVRDPEVQRQAKRVKDARMNQRKPAAA